MGFSDDGSIKKGRGRSWNRALAPLFGLLIVGASIAIALVLAEPIFNALLDAIPSVPAVDEVLLAVGVIIFVVCLAIFGGLYAVVAPKPNKATYVTERELDRLKQERAAEEKAKDRRKKEMRRRMREHNRNS
ncbi:MAG: hypothetical protein H6670_07615 [Anaerolineaceae bacterium]|nr:hypothetical protein [Anaerolineae bacterium]MCB9459501.1 hypothetical protein [Anaerolineaceae bacterium]